MKQRWYGLKEILLKKELISIKCYWLGEEEKSYHKYDNELLNYWYDEFSTL